MPQNKTEGKYIYTCKIAVGVENKNDKDTHTN